MQYLTGGAMLATVHNPDGNQDDFSLVSKRGDLAVTRAPIGAFDRVRFKSET